jgi:hypothetical protein
MRNSVNHILENTNAVELQNVVLTDGEGCNCAGDRISHDDEENKFNKIMKTIKKQTIMKKILTFAAIAAVLVLSSCSQDSLIETPSEEAIGFSAFSPVPTKGTVLTGTSLESHWTSFYVDAFQGSTAFMTDLQYTYGTTWDYANSSYKKYWPSDTETGIDFYAYAPAKDDNFAVNVTSAAQSLLITVPQTVTAQEDILYAECVGATKDDRNGSADGTPTSGSVPMVFKHALSQINFMVKNSATDVIDVTVTGIAVQNVKNQTSCTFAGVSSVPESATSADYSAGLSVVSFSLTDTAVNVMADNGHLILAPQTTAAWTPASENNGARFAITCKVKDHNSDVVYYDGTVYIPVSVNWEAAKNYTYTFVFGEGAGYDEGGKEVLNMITFTPSVTDWTNVSEPSTNM